MPDERLTPLEIEQIQFKRSLRGYAPALVDEFLKLISHDYQLALRENMQARTELETVKAEVQRFKEMESALKDALILAQRAADETRANAHKEADLLVSEARQTAARLEDESRQKLERYRWEIERLRIDRENFINEFKSMLNAALTRMERTDIDPPSAALTQMNIGMEHQIEEPKEIEIDDDPDLFLTDVSAIKAKMKADAG